MAVTERVAAYQGLQLRGVPLYNWGEPERAPHKWYSSVLTLYGGDGGGGGGMSVSHCSIFAVQGPHVIFYTAQSAYSKHAWH